MKIWAVIFGAILVTACTHLNRYDGDDAAFIPVPCNQRPVEANDGKWYMPVSVEINSIDGTFTGSGQHCKDKYVYRIKPGLKKIIVIANYMSQDTIVSGKIAISAILHPQKTYELQTSFSGKEMSAILIDPITAKVIGQGTTSEISTGGAQRSMIMPIFIRR